jgi:hypothetical protein
MTSEGFDMVPRFFNIVILREPKFRIKFTCQILINVAL